MNKDDVSTKILKEMRAGFKQVDKRFKQVDKRFEQVDKRFEQVDKRFEQVDKRFDGMDARFDRLEKRVDFLETRFDDLTVMTVGHDHRMNDFLTRAEFEEYKTANMAMHDRTASMIEYLIGEFKAFNKAHSRLEDRVDAHEQVLISHHLMNVA